MNTLQLMYINLENMISTKHNVIENIEKEVQVILSNKIINGQLDVTKSHTLFVSTIYGAAAVTLIPKNLSH